MIDTKHHHELANKLRGHQRSMFAFLLERGTSKTLDIATHCGATNVSQIISCTNRRLEALGETVRVKNLADRKRGSGQYAEWAIVEGAANE